MKVSESKRAARVGEQIMREISLLLREEVADPRLVSVTVTGARLNPDFSVAEVFYTALGDEQEHIRVADGLARAKGFLRSKLNKRLKLRISPEIRFIRDEFLEKMVYVGQSE